MASLNTTTAAVTEQPTDDGAPPVPQSPMVNTMVRWGPGEMGRGCCWTLFTCPYRASQASPLSSITEQERDFANFCNVSLVYISCRLLICSCESSSICLSILYVAHCSYGQSYGHPRPEWAGGGIGSGKRRPQSVGEEGRM